MDWSVILSAIGAVATGAGGCILVIHEFRRRDRRALKRELDDLSVDVSELRSDLVNYRRYVFLLAEKLVEHGIDMPDPPTMRHGGGPR